MNVGIVGCGLIGQKRAQALAGCQLVACADVNPSRAENLAQTYGATALTDWRALIERPEVSIVVVAKLHDSLAEIARAAAAAGKHVLVEKPAARRASELPPVITTAQTAGVCVRVGFNHRYHRALRRARDILNAGALGELMYVRGRYGHGGRIGYEQEWRANPALSGGGELIDQGVHLIDLARWFLGEFVVVQGHAPTYYWKMPVEDNGFMLLRTARGQIAFLHASCTEWKNLFSLEIFGRDGKLEVNGLGGSYGVERLTHYRMLQQMGPPETTTWEYPMGDDSWEVEFAEFIEDIKLGRQPAPGLMDARAALEIVEQIYTQTASAQEGSCL
jgi:predicted dehydrogenase